MTDLSLKHIPQKGMTWKEELYRSAITAFIPDYFVVMFVIIASGAWTRLSISALISVGFLLYISLWIYPFLLTVITRQTAWQIKKFIDRKGASK